MKHYSIMYSSSKTDHNQDIQHYRSGSSLALLEDYWGSMEASLKAKDIAAAIMYCVDMDLSTGEVSFEKIKHISRALPKTLEINKPSGPPKKKLVSKNVPTFSWNPQPVAPVGENPYAPESNEFHAWHYYHVLGYKGTNPWNPLNGSTHEARAQAWHTIKALALAQSEEPVQPTPVPPVFNVVGNPYQDGTPHYYAWRQYHIMGRRNNNPWEGALTPDSLARFNAWVEVKQLAEDGQLEQQLSF